MVKIIKLIGGMDVITEIKDDNEQIWHYPFIIMSHQGQGGMHHNLQILCPHHKDFYAKVTIRSTDSILLSFEPEQYFIDLYNKAAENIRMQVAGIVAPDKKQTRNLIL